MQVKWSDIGLSDSPGEYKINDRTVRVQKSDLDIWKEQQDTIFSIIDARFSDGGIGQIIVLRNQGDDPSRLEIA